jgi:uncharacterized protein YneF (UPF0154 family)
MDLSSNLWTSIISNIVGVIVGVLIGGLITWLISRHYYREQSRETEQMVARAREMFAQAQGMLDNLGRFMEGLAGILTQGGDVNIHFKRGEKGEVTGVTKNYNVKLETGALLVTGFSPTVTVTKPPITDARTGRRQTDDGSS